ncbi:hypothetical protein GGF46_002085 [Coemansia sp. RSA 552]|nr:hypothetical protein GGF46_002085 [Coemansia sp. RSA 552]
MKRTLSVSVGMLALAAATQGSLLSKLLGNLNIQISACPDLSLGTSSSKDDKPTKQSSNPACPNYVPPSKLFSEESNLEESSDAESQDPSDVALYGIDSSVGIAGGRTAQVPALPAAPETTMPAYQLSPLPPPLPTPTNRDLLAEATVRSSNPGEQPAPMATMTPTAEPMATPSKCVYMAQNPSVIIDGLPFLSSAQQALATRPAAPAPWDGANWYQGAPAPAAPQPPAAEWAWFTAGQPAPAIPAPIMPAPAIPAPIMPAPTPLAPVPAAPAENGVFTGATQGTVTFHIPDGAEGVFFGTRNVGAYNFAE